MCATLRTLGFLMIGLTAALWADPVYRAVASVIPDGDPISRLILTCMTVGLACWTTALIVSALTPKPTHGSHRRLNALPIVRALMQWTILIAALPIAAIAAITLML